MPIPKIKCLDCGCRFDYHDAAIGIGGDWDEKIMLCPSCRSNQLEEEERWYEDDE